MPRFIQCVVASVLMLALLPASAHFACAQEAPAQNLAPGPQAPVPEDETSGFFSYLPAAPKLHLPRLKIPFWTSDLKTARKAYDKGDYDKALKFFKLASDDGNVIADWYLGHMYRTGRGVAQDDTKAFSYYSRVAQAYDPDESNKTKMRIVIDSQIRLADYYRTGIGVADMKPDFARAYNSYLQLATTYGHPAASYGLGLMNINGQGVNRNPKQGLKWMAAAARKRYAPAEAFLGDAYWTGRLVPEDKTRGLMWYILASQSVSPQDFPEIYTRVDLMRTALKQDDVLEAEARAKVWNAQFPVAEGVDGG